MTKFNKVTAKNINMYSYLGDYGGCGTIRVLYPYMLLNQHRVKDVGFTAYANAHFITSINFYGNYTWLQFQRAATPQHLDILKVFISKVRDQVKVPIFYEIDDHLFGIPKWNMAYEFYEKHKTYIEDIMKQVNGIIVSTNKLKEVYSYLNPNIGVVENHLPMFVWGKSKPNINDTKRLKIVYPGSANHFDITNEMRGGDMDKTLLNFIRNTTKKYEWIFIGGFPKEILDLANSGKVKKLPWVKTLNLAGYLRELKADIGIAPLDTSPECLEFNESKCLVGNTLMVTNNGIKRLQIISPEEKIWQETTFEKVSNNFKYEKRKTIKLTTKRGYSIEGTEIHKLRTNGKFEEISKLQIGDNLDLSFFDYPELPYQKITFPFFLTKKIDTIDFTKLDDEMLPTITINEEWGRFIGYVLGDGHLSSSNSVSISCDKKHTDVIEDVIKFGEKIGVNFYKVGKKKKDGYTGNGLDIKLSSRNLNHLLKSKIGFEGVYGKELKVPEIIFKSPKSVIKEFIKGLFETDGTVSKDHCCISLTSKNKQLIQEVQFLLLGFKILSNIRENYNKYYKRYYYELKLNRQSCDVFEREIGFFSKEKKEKLNNITQKQHSNAYKEWEMFDKIVKIEYGEDDVYDVEVPNKHYYMANGIVSHNSNIKALEYTAIGIPGVYTRIEPYKNLKCTAENSEYFIHYIEKMESADFRLKVYQHDYMTLKRQLYWEGEDYKGENLTNYVNTYLNLLGWQI